VIPALFALALAAAHQAPAAPPGDPVEKRRSEVARDLVRLGQELRGQIVAGDARALAARIPADGLRCAGRVVPRARVQRDLSTPGSWLHDTLLGAPGLHGSGSAPASVAELLRTASEVAIAVSFVHDPRAEPLGRPCLEYRVKDVVGPTAPLCFERREGKWWFTESLYPCG
jgi:hypothetical protein